MTKKIGLSIIVLLQSVYGFVQNVPAYGAVSQDDLKITGCDFDKNAEALVLFDIGKFACFFYPGSTTPITTEFNRHIRIKILNEKGLKQANIHIPYYSSGKEKIKNISAQTYNPDASGKWAISKVEKTLIYDKKINNRLSEKVFAFPDVTVGSIIEYKYTVSESGLHNWYFKKDIPVKVSSYTVDFPFDFELLSTPLCILPVDVNTQKDKLRTLKTFTMKDIVPLRDEPFMGSSEDYLQRIESNILSVTTSRGRQNYMPGWPTIISELMEDADFGIQIRKDIPQTVDLEARLNTISDPYKKMVAVHEYVRKNMVWNGYNNIWALNGVKEAWKDKKGTTGEINLILINLLKNAGLNVYPILVSTHDNGKVYLERPSISQFNKVLAYVKIGEKIYVLDATEKNTPANLIPSDVMNTWALILKKLKNNLYEWEWQVLWDKEKLNKNTVILKAAITEDGNMKGNALIYSYEYARVERSPAIKEDSLKFINEKLIAGNREITIDSFYVENQSADTFPLIQKIHFNQRISSSGDYKYFSVNLFAGLETNPFISDTRFSDVLFGVNQQYNIEGSFTAPVGYSFEELPENISLTTPDNSISITRFLEVANNTLFVNIILKFKKPFYAVDKYADFRVFYKKLFDLLNEQYVIRKSKT